MATQAAVLAGFTTTCIIEITIPETANPYAKSLLHVCGIVSICSNITCVSLSTITTIWGSGKALRGSDGSMDEAVEGINQERGIIFSAFALGLAGNLSTVLCACFILMDQPAAVLCSMIVVYTLWMIYTNARRIQTKFDLSETVRLDDLTSYNVHRNASTSPMAIAGTSSSNGQTSSSSSLLGRSRKSLADIV
eukprot:CAMPEP_0170421542 /NCGR_PEP_ID=MMETSP0117_2-20130122/35954_1 /TAXON_ID=400756 /ORGANISM="Durinskia baltica, Strain CSIRO CS-38" /LENGTH=192 /DNA_ID=CAMNT_0010680099 /DNA_START=32 /DNA_END=610 /DNA_ORIENTATION=-